jgi:hypothetical protein
MGNDKTTTIHLNDEQAEFWLFCQKHYQAIQVFKASRLFEQRAATITMRIDKSGAIRDLARNDSLYSTEANFINQNP